MNNMKKAILALIVLLLAINIASAQKFSGIRVDDTVKSGDYLEAHANIRNTLSTTIKHGNLVFWMPDIEIYEKSSSFNIPKDINYGRYMHVYIPQNTEPGIYLARVSFIHDGKVQHQWRYVEVE
jgi:hypothetical protein